MRGEARRSDGGADWGAEQRASAAAGPTGEPGDAGGRGGVAFVGVCSAVVPSRRSACARMADGTAVGWGEDYERYVLMAIADASADSAAHSARATPARAAAAPRGWGLQA